MTIQEATRHINKQLTTIYDEAEASGISDWVIENLTVTKRTDRLISKGRLITQEQDKQIEQCITRLLMHEPVQYVLNEAWAG